MRKKQGRTMPSLWMELITDIFLVILAVIVVVIACMYMKRMDEYEKTYWATEGQEYTQIMEDNKWQKTEVLLKP